MASIIRGYQLSKVVHTMAQLNIADLLSDCARSASDLAELTNTHADSLERLLYTLTCFGILTEEKQGMFSLTPLGATLRSNDPNSLRHTALAWCHLAIYDSWKNLADCIRTGNTSFDKIFGTDFYHYLQENTEFNGVFNRAMSSMKRHVEVISKYDFSKAKRVLDVGSGKGIFMMNLLRQYSHLAGILFDLPHAIDDAHKIFTETGSDLLDRLSTVTGNMFESVPSGADTVVLSHILMSFDDSPCNLILRNCRAAMNTDDILLIIDVVLRNELAQPAGRLADLNMLVLLGGRHRTEKQYRELIEKTGFIIESITEMDCEDHLLTCRAI